MNIQDTNHKILSAILTNKRGPFYAVDEETYREAIKIARSIKFTARPNHHWSDELRDFEIKEDLKTTEEGYRYSEFREAEHNEDADYDVDIYFLNERYDDEGADNNGDDRREDGTLIDWEEYMSDVRRGAYAAMIKQGDNRPYYFVSKKMHKFIRKNQNINQIINED